LKLNNFQADPENQDVWLSSFQAVGLSSCQAVGLSSCPEKIIKDNLNACMNREELEKRLIEVRFEVVRKVS
jgi:hypothetical protein